jgi:hypothetical protein
MASSPAALVREPGVTRRRRRWRNVQLPSHACSSDPPSIVTKQRKHRSLWVGPSQTRPRVNLHPEGQFGCDAGHHADVNNSHSQPRYRRETCVMPSDRFGSKAVIGERPLSARSGHSQTRYSINWVARSRTDCGILMPSALAVLRLTTRSNVVGRSTGMLAGLSPFKSLSTK